MFRYLIFAVFLLPSGVMADLDSTSKLVPLVESLNLAGLDLNNFEKEEHNPDSPIPNTAREWVTFSIGRISPKGGQLFVFSKIKYADSVYEYFEALSFLAGPYIFKSNDGLVVAQLNSGLPVEEAEMFEAALSKFSID